MHKATASNNTSVKPYVLSSLGCIPGLKKTGPSAKGKRTKLQNFEEAMSKTSLPLFLWDEANREYKRMLVDYEKLSAAHEKYGGAQVFGDWSSWGEVLTLRAQQTENRAKVRLDSLDRFFEDLWKQPTDNRRKSAAHKWVEDFVLKAVVNERQLLRHAESAGEEDGSLVKLMQDIAQASEAQPDQEGFAIFPERYLTKAVYGRSFAENFQASLQGQGSAVMNAAFCGHSMDVDMKDCYGRILLRLLRRHGIFNEEKHGFIRLSTENITAWRQAVADVLGISLDDAKTEILRVRFGGCARADIPFLRVLASQIDTAVDELLQLQEYNWVSAEYGDRLNPKYSRLAAIMSFEERQLMTQIKEALADAGCPLYCHKHDGGIFGACPAYKRLHALDAMQILSHELGVDVVHKPFVHDAKYPFASIPAALVREGKMVDDAGPLAHLHGKSMCLYNAVSFLDPDSCQTIGVCALLLLIFSFVMCSFHNIRD